MPSFLQALKTATNRYMRYTARKVKKKATRNIIKNALERTTEIIPAGMRFKVPTYSDFATGNVFLSGKMLSQRLKKSIQKRNEDFMQSVFDLSQEYVPIDKRYAEAKNLKFLSRRVQRDIATYKDESSFAKSFSGSDYGKRTFIANYLVKGDYKRVMYSDLTSFTRESGWYEADEVDFIKSTMVGRTRDILNRVYYNESDKTVHVRNSNNYLRKDFTSESTGFSLNKSPYKDISEFKRTSIQPSGGYQELKKGGFINREDPNDIYIFYSAYDKTRPMNKFNYAALQHDNLAFKHSYSRRSLFLWKAFTEKRRDWWQRVREGVLEELKK